MTRLSRLAFLLGILFTASPSFAQEDLAKAKELFKQAEARFKSSDFRTALELYQQAYAAKPLPGFHFNIAQCHRNLGEYAKAIEHFRLYLESANAKHAAEAKRLIQLCEAELAKQPPPTSTETKPEPATAPVVTKPPEPAPRPRKRLRPPIFWTGVAVSVALLATGTITGALALQKSSRFKDPATPQAELVGLRDTGKTLRTTSTVTFAIGAATSVTTAVLFFFTEFRPAERTLSAAPIPGGAMVSIAGGF